VLSFHSINSKQLNKCLFRICIAPVVRNDYAMPTLKNNRSLVLKQLAT